MAADEFFNRWKKQNELARQARADAAAAEPEPPAPDPWQDRLPTQEDVQMASPTDADFSPFMKQGVDESVKRSALKKLFTDPHFNVMDGLDIYTGDYTQSDPIPPEMMAMLKHAKSLFDPPGMHGQSVMSMQEQEITPPTDDTGAPPVAESVPETAAATGPVPEPARESANESEPASEADAGQGALPASPLAASPLPAEPAPHLAVPADGRQPDAADTAAPIARQRDAAPARKPS